MTADVRACTASIRDTNLLKATPLPLPGPLVPPHPESPFHLPLCVPLPAPHLSPTVVPAPAAPCLVPREQSLPGHQRQGSQSLRLKCAWDLRVAGPRVAVFQDAGPTLTRHTFWAGCQRPGSEQDPAQKMGLEAGRGVGGPATTLCAAGLAMSYRLPVWAGGWCGDQDPESRSRSWMGAWTIRSFPQFPPGELQGHSRSCGRVLVGWV